MLYNKIKVNRLRREIMRKPNVIIVLTDDQGYPDLGCNGNPWIKTPNIDQFSKDGFKFNDFHVGPLCAPTRGGIMTGRRALRNGVWATCWGRSILKIGEYTLGNLFEDNGYKTGMFGKWHMGDNYPCRPEDKGFQRVVAHKGGGVGQTGDFWGNNYFDDTYFEDSKPTKYDGYCTDVWFDQAKNFISENKDEPFFAYIATNAPHSPYLVDEKYSKLYSENKDIPNPDFYGMITNIDENFGDLRKFLKENELEDDTILIFLTDNGSSGSANLDKETGLAVKGYNAGLRGMKGSYYDGGHKVPFFIRYPNGKIENGEVDELCMHTDILPTLAQMCDLDYSKDLVLDGKSFAKTFNGEKMNERFEFLQNRQSSIVPEKWTNAVLYGKYRLVFGKELYDISIDPSQQNNIADENPEIVKAMREAHEKWWDEIFEQAVEVTPIVLGNEHENPTTLCSMDMFEIGMTAWSHSHVAKTLQNCGNWNVRFDHDGDYKFTLLRWPEEAKKTINEYITEAEFGKLANYTRDDMPFNNQHFKSATIEVDGKKYSKNIADEDANVEFEIANIAQHDTVLKACFITEKGEEYGSYYLEVQAK